MNKTVNFVSGTSGRLRSRIAKPLLSLGLLVAAISTSSATPITYAFSADVPTNNGPMPGSFTLTVPDYIQPAPLTQFMGKDFQSCSSPGAGDCLAQFSIGPSPVSGLSDKIGFGRDNCCFIYFFPENSFQTLGTYVADSFHSAGPAMLTVSEVGVPEPATFGPVLIALALVLAGVRRRKHKECGQE